MNTINPNRFPSVAQQPLTATPGPTERSRTPHLDNALVNTINSTNRLPSMPQQPLTAPLGPTQRSRTPHLDNPLAQLRVGGVMREPSIPVDAFGAGGFGAHESRMAPGHLPARDLFEEPTGFEAPRGFSVPRELEAPVAFEAPVAAEAPEAPEAPQSEGLSATQKRPKGDNRSAEDIVNDTPVLAKLGRQKDIKFDQLCKQTGVDPKLSLKDAKQNPDAVYRLAKVLEHIDSAKSSTGGDRSNKVKDGQGDGNIEGITKDGDARHGTEAGMVKDFAEKGYSSLGADHQLPTTSDTHVKADGSNKDNFQWFAGEVGKHTWFVPGLSNVLTGIGESEGGVGGVFKGAAEGVLNTWKGAAEGVLSAVTTGKVNPATLALGAYAGALGETEAAPEVVKDIANFFA